MGRPGSGGRSLGPFFSAWRWGAILSRSLEGYVATLINRTGSTHDRLKTVLTQRHEPGMLPCNMPGSCYGSASLGGRKALRRGERWLTFEGVDRKGAHHGWAATAEPHL